MKSFKLTNAIKEKINFLKIVLTLLPIYVILISPADLYAQLLVPSQYSTIQAALNSALNGETIKVSPGTYYENLQWPNTINIKLITDGDSNNVFIDGGYNDRVINIDNVNIGCLTIIKGFTIMHGFNSNTVASGAGINVNINSLNFLTIEDVNIKENVLESSSWNQGAGIHVKGGLTKIVNSLIQKNKISGKSDWAFGAGISVEGDLELSRVKILYNKINANNARVKGAGVYVQGNLTMKRCNVSYNKIKNNRWTLGVGIYAERGMASNTFFNLENTLISNNLFINPSSTVSNGGGLYANEGTVNIMNCTIADNGEINGIIKGAGICTHETNVNITNSILWNPLGLELENHSMGNDTLNNFNVNYSILEETYTGQNNQTINPGFAGNGDYHLNPSSPAIDGGTLTNAPLKDLENKARPNGNGIDIGAYEYHIMNISGVQDIVNELNLTVYPNPTTDKLKISLNSSVDENVKFKLYDLTGKLIIKHEFNTITEINVSDLLSGMYFATIEALDQKASVKIYKK